MVYSVMDRIKTRDFLKSEIDKNERLVVVRYSDGEFNLLHNKKGIALTTGNENSSLLESRMKEVMKKKNHFMCINELKKKNIEKKDKWVKVQKYLASVGERETYGAANWNIYDFQNENKVLPYFFSGKALLLTAFPKESEIIFKHINPNLEVYATPKKEMSRYYDTHYKELKKKIVSENYDNILFSCGPTGKVLMIELCDSCKSNMIDTGSLINAMLEGRGFSNITKKWSMSWTRTADLKKCSKNLLDGVRDIL